MPQPPSRRLAAITLACLLAAGGAAAIAPGASALATVSSEPTSTQAPTAFRPGSASDDAVARGPVRYTNALIGGESLARGESITSEGGEYRFVLQTDGNAVIYDYRGSTWSTGTQGRGDRLDMQTDGNVVIYAADGRAVWSTGTGGNPGALLVMQDDGDLVVFRADDSVAWSSSDGQAPPAVADTLSSGSDLRAGQELVSTDGRSRAAMQTDGNFVVYSGGAVRFNAATSGPGNRLVMQSDGNAVVYANYGAPLWQSGTAGNRLVMQGDGNAVVYSASGRALWQSGTAGTFGPRMVIQNDGNLVIYSVDDRAAWQSNQPAPAPAPVGNPGDAVNCDSFGSQADAQVWFDRYRAFGDPAVLDRDKDGIACEDYRY